MTIALAVAAGLAVALVARRPRVGFAVALVAWQPLMSIGGGGVAVLWWRWRMIARIRRRRRRLIEEAVLYGELVGLGIAAGMPFLTAAARAGEWVSDVLAADIDVMLRSAHSSGSAAALAGSEGPIAPLFHLVARAVATGAAVGPAVAGFVLDARQSQRAERLAAVKRLPVRMLVPLTLLILPGFIVLTLGPALVSGLGRLQL